MAEDRHLEALTIEECLELASQQAVGRIAVDATPNPPLVVPVTFVLDGTSVVFRSDPGEKLARVGQTVSFQVDWTDPVHRTGWSVLFQGTITVQDVDEVAHLDLEPWVGPRSHWVRLVPDVITGRRLALHSPELDGRGYR